MTVIAELNKMITSMGGDDNQQSFVNPNLIIHDLTDDVQKDKSSSFNPLQGTTCCTMMGFCEDDSSPIRFNPQIRFDATESNSIDSHLQTPQHPDIEDHDDSEDDTDLPLNGITVMGKSEADSVAIKFRGNNRIPPPLNRDDFEDDTLLTIPSGVTMIGDIDPSKDSLFDDEMRTKSSNSLFDDKTRTKLSNHRSISTESYWRMFVFQKPHLFTLIASFLLPFEKMQLSPICSFIHKFVSYSQWKHIDDQDQNGDLHRYDDIPLSSPRSYRRWQNHEIIDLNVDYRLWNEQYSHQIDQWDHRSLRLDMKAMNDNVKNCNFWNSSTVKLLLYYLVHQKLLVQIYHSIEHRFSLHSPSSMNNNNDFNIFNVTEVEVHRNEKEKEKKESIDDEHRAPLSQTLDNIETLNCNDNGTEFGTDGLMFCVVVLSSPYCKLQSITLRNNGLTDDAIQLFSDKLLRNQWPMKQLVELDLSQNQDITGESMQSLMSLIGEKCNVLECLDLSGTSVDDRVCDAIFSYFRCFYGTSISNLKRIAMDDTLVSWEGMRTLNRLFGGHLIESTEPIRISCVDCHWLQYMERPKHLDWRILVAKDNEGYSDKIETLTL